MRFVSLTSAVVLHVLAHLLRVLFHSSRQPFSFSIHFIQYANPIQKAAHVVSITTSMYQVFVKVCDTSHYNSHSGFG